MNIENQSKKTFAIYVEPWGVGYWIKPNERFHIGALDAISDVEYDIVYHSADLVSVYISGANDFTVMQDGVVLEHGHQSPDAGD